MENNYLFSIFTTNINYNYFLLNFNLFFFNYNYNLYINYNLYKSYWINNNNRSYIMFHIFFLNIIQNNICYFFKNLNFFFKEKKFLFYTFKPKKIKKKKKKKFSFKLKKRKIYKYKLLVLKKNLLAKSNIVDINTLLYYYIYKCKNYKLLQTFTNFKKFNNTYTIDDQKLQLCIKNKIYFNLKNFVNNTFTVNNYVYCIYKYNTTISNKKNLNFFLKRLKFFNRYRIIRRKKKFLKFFFIIHNKNVKYSVMLHKYSILCKFNFKLTVSHIHIYFDKFVFVYISSQFKMVENAFLSNLYSLKKKKRKWWSKFKFFLRKRIFNRILYWNDNFKQSIIKMYNKNNLNFYSNNYYYSILQKYSYFNKYSCKKYRIFKHKHKYKIKYNHITPKQHNYTLNSKPLNFFENITPLIYIYNNHFPLYNTPKIYIKYFYKKIYKSHLNKSIKPLHYKLLSFLENILSKNIFLKLGGNNNVKHFKKKYEFWKLKLLYTHFKRFSRIKIHKTFRISEALELIWYTFLIKDVTMLKQWIVKILQKTHWKTHKSFLNLFEILVKDQFKLYSYELKVKGFLFDARGKISAAGNAKKKKYNFIAGKINRASKFSKVDFQQTVVKSTGGIFGITMILHF